MSGTLTTHDVAAWIPWPGVKGDRGRYLPCVPAPDGPGTADDRAAGSLLRPLPAGQGGDPMTGTSRPHDGRGLVVDVSAVAFPVTGAVNPVRVDGTRESAPGHVRVP